MTARSHTRTARAKRRRNKRVGALQNAKAARRGKDKR